MRVSAFSISRRWSHFLAGTRNDHTGLSSKGGRPAVAHPRLLLHSGHPGEGPNKTTTVSDRHDNATTTLKLTSRATEDANAAPTRDKDARISSPVVMAAAAAATTVPDMRGTPEPYSRRGVPGTSIGSLNRFSQGVSFTSTISNMLHVTVTGKNDRAKREGQIYLLYHHVLDSVQVRTQYFVERCDIEDTFNTWFLFTVLHVWMLVVKLRGTRFPDMTDEKSGELAQKYILLLSSYFLKDAEERLKQFNLRSSVFSKTVKEYFGFFHGNIYAYDESVFHSDSLLAAALWRNALGGKDVDTRALVEIVTMVRKDLHVLDKAAIDDVLVGNFTFTTLPQLKAKNSNTVFKSTAK